MVDLSRKLTSRDLRHPEVMEGLLDVARVQAFGSIRQRADLLMGRREECQVRGYHQVSREPKSDKDLMICYDCEVWTDKAFLDSIGFAYRVNPI